MRENSQIRNIASPIVAAMLVTSIFAVAGISMISSGRNAHADTVTWIGPTAGTWSDPDNWDTGSVPTSTDNIVISGDTSSVSDSKQVHLDIDFTLAASARITLSSTTGFSTCMVDEPIPCTYNLVILPGKTLQNNGIITIEEFGGLLNDGTLDNFGTLISNGLISNGFSTNQAGTLNNYNMLNNEEWIINAELGVITNKDGATMTNDNTIDNDGTITNECDATFINKGTVNGNPVEDDTTCGSAPEAPVNQDVETNVNTALVIDLGSDPDSDSMTLTMVNDPTDGSLGDFDSDTAEITYTPDTNFVGSDKFQYKLCDTTDQCSEVGEVHITVKDNLAPVVTLTPDRSPDSNGYYNHDVTFTVTGDDTNTGNSGIDSCDDPITYSGPDGNSVDVNGECTDNAGNTGTGTATINYDETKPTITSSNDGQTYILNQPGISPNKACNDNLSGVASCIASVSTLATNTVGPHSFTITATDSAGNTLTKTINYNVGYKFTGFKAPIPNSQYNLGRVVPVKLQLFDYNNVAQSGASLKMFVKDDSWSTQQAGKPGTSSDNKVVNTGNNFKYDSSSKTYIYNLSTTPKDYNPQMTKGTVTLIAQAQDGIAHSVNIILK